MEAAAAVLVMLVSAQLTAIVTGVFSIFTSAQPTVIVTGPDELLPGVVSPVEVTVAVFGDRRAVRGRGRRRDRDLLGRADRHGGERAREQAAGDGTGARIGGDLPALTGSTGLTWSFEGTNTVAGTAAGADYT
jgi:hypothetical protein